MTDLRTPENVDVNEGVAEADLVPADDTIIGKAFLWSLVAFLAVGVCVGASMWLLRPRDVAPPAVESVFVPPRSIDAPATPPPSLTFTDITAQAGIDFVHHNGATGDKLLPETMGGGCAFLDFDNDADQDILLINSTDWPWSTPSGSPHTMGLYRNDGTGRFENVTAGSGLGVSFYGMGAAVGDYDNDGDVDVYITAVGFNHLFQNTGGYFRDVTDAAGVAGDSDQWATSAGFLDYDRDGWLDLFVCRYVKWSREIDFAVNYQLLGIGRAYGPPMNFEGVHCLLFRNNRDGTFRDVSEDAGICVTNAATGKAMAKALGLAPVDVDRDGWMDILVANDTVQKFLFRNRGDGTFEEIGAATGLAFDRNGKATGAMGADSAYYRNDAALGFGVANFANEMTGLFVSQGDPLQFADEAITEGIGAPSRLLLKFGLFFFDVDLDGRLDLLECNGHLEEEINVVQSSQQYLQPAQLFWNAGPDNKSCFVEVPRSDTGDLAKPIVGRGAAYADIDADGDLDVLLTQIGGPPLLLRNDQQLGGRWVRLKLTGRKANKDAIGAIVDLTSNGATQRRQVMPTRSYLSQVELPLTFGLSPSASEVSVRITWPDNTVQEVREIAVDQTVVVTESE